MATELGVEIRTKSRVADRRRPRHATGVMLAGGRHIAAEAVIANVDVATVYGHLLPPARARSSRRPTAAGDLLFGVCAAAGHRRHPSATGPPQHLLQSRYRANSTNFRRGIPPKIRLSMSPSRRRPTLTMRAGLRKLVRARRRPAVGAGIRLVPAAKQYRKRVLETLASFGAGHPPAHPRQSHMTPEDIRR